MTARRLEAEQREEQIRKEARQRAVEGYIRDADIQVSRGAADVDRGLRRDARHRRQA